MTKKGKKLIFISRIHRDGSGTEIVDNTEMQLIYGDDRFKISCLSLSQRTFIASGFNSFVVKLKPKKEKP